MKHTLKTALCLVLALTFVMSSLVGCNRGENGDSANQQKADAIQQGKTILTVGNCYGGFKDYWLVAVKERFEAEYADYSFEEGKKGVYIDISNSGYTGTKLINTIRNSGIDMYFTESVYYYDFVNQGLFKDITDVVTDDLTAFGEYESIEDKLPESYKDFLNSDGKYYAIPFYEAYSPIVYDKDLFDEYGLYMMSDNVSFLGRQTGYSGELTDEWKAQLGTGPDGQSGTDDDGFPRTYEEFFKLCDYMADVCNITPFTWPGGYQDYVTDLATALACDVEGSEYMLNWSVSGTATGLVDSIAADGTVTLKDATEISESNSELLATQAGKYYALSFVETITKTQKYRTQDSVGAGSQYDSQYTFLAGKVDDRITKVAMLIDGSWWENEATQSFTQLSSDDPSQSKENRKFGILPLPKPTEDYVGEGMSIPCTKYSLCFINADCEDGSGKLNAAKLFLQYCHTDVSLVEFNQIVGCAKPYDYEMTEEELAECTYYGRAVYNLHKTANIIYPFSKTATYINGPSSYDTLQMFKTTASGGFKNPTQAFYTSTNLTAKDYFEGLYWMNN